MKKKLIEIREKVNNSLTSMYFGLKGRVANEKGVSTIEWVGLAAVIIALMFALATAMKTSGGDLSEVIITKLKEMIEGINS
ncbi:hypothetical protein ACTHO0_20170 [Cytobacillus praedii]|uniref:Uncharacterized protein n=2 Tax=Cytobacillus TaxID=2675230 RepID=A0A0Q3VIA3_9BACI|nr:MULTISPECIES: hypothetical protein [Cytobacillus]KOP83351.1 hypothetical protein AMS60_13195 [Bacillus sp. FJAT-21945]KQL20375.1 hypothetical protein AN957_18495 [Cytobacillus solani]MED3551130.1 hypothetical protein [Cytobacillus praedii]TCJ02190.1 hypothetical protein E0Y62_20535 [Cytobacillus praedii]USK53639.1 hypothetical protein LIS82_18800 [Cytobacillus solani]